METLEREFSNYRTTHIWSVLLAKMIDYYRTLEMGQVNIPDFMRNDTPEEKAKEAVEDLYNRDIDEFYKLYETAYQELAILGDF